MTIDDMSIDGLLGRAVADTPLTVPDTWTQGRTIYGGLSAALISQAIRQQVDENKPLRSLNVAFAAPSNASESFKLETELLREGRNVAQWVGRLVQDGTACVQVQAVYGAAIPSDLNVQSFEAPDLPGLDKSVVYPTEGGAGFSRYFDIAQAEGDMPVSGGSSMKLGGWMRFKEAPQTISEAHLICLVDVWPPATFMLMTSVKAGSTVNWTMQFPQPMPEVSGDEYIGYQAQIKYSQDGFGVTHAQLWNQKKELLAYSQQTVLLFS